MDNAATITFLMDMFEAVDGVKATDFDLAMTRARIADPLGRAPLDPEWAATFDEWIAAAEVAELLHLRGAMSPAETIRQFNSEGASFVFGDSSPDWASVAAQLRGRSTLAANVGWAMVEMPREGHEFHPRSAEW